MVESSEAMVSQLRIGSCWTIRPKDESGPISGGWPVEICWWTRVLTSSCTYLDLCI